jgi:hypothetical protein
MVMPASAAVILDFSIGDAGQDGGINVASATSFCRHHHRHSDRRDGGYNGVYDVIGNADGNLESKVGNLSFSTDAEPL